MLAHASMMGWSSLEQRGSSASSRCAHASRSPARTLAAYAAAIASSSSTRRAIASTAASLTQWQDRLVVVNFWATWCAPCRKEMPELDRFQQKHAANGVQVVGVALDGTADVEAFLRDTPVGYPILLAPNPAANPSLPFGNTYGALPFSVLLGRDGRILDTRLGEVSEAVLEGWIAPHH